MDRFQQLRQSKASFSGMLPSHVAAYPPPGGVPMGVTLSEYHRGSMSTQRTSMSDLSMRDTAYDAHAALSVPRMPARTKGTYRLTDFHIERTLGTGSFGRVHLVRSRHNMRYYAIKVLSKEKIVRTKQVEHTNNEQAMLDIVQHPFIVNLWGAFQDNTNLYMVMDFVPGGELFTLLRKSGRFPDAVAKFYSAEVALALHHLHSRDIIYRDLKPENILINHDGHIKIADFGFSKMCDNTTWTLCGTPDYLAPEIVRQQRYNKSVDWYALGILIYEMLWGYPPYHMEERNHFQLYEMIQQGPRCIRRWPAFERWATDLILKLMDEDPTKRLGNMKHGARDVFSHPWFKEVNWEQLLARAIPAPYVPRISRAGDASAFELYPEDNATAMYGISGPDPHGDDFPNFEHTSRMP